jgi:hypothetical protein
MLLVLERSTVVERPWKGVRLRCGVGAEAGLFNTDSVSAARVLTGLTQGSPTLSASLPEYKRHERCRVPDATSTIRGYATYFLPVDVEE